ncbi:MAG: DUF4384 domain-containing protein [Thermodesulfovibrionales bacterium]|nr:DUF4384 domain-containing protein [Thermodesulfovibrionales bacterium]
MNKLKFIGIFSLLITAFFTCYTVEAAPKGAKALFHSGEGPSTGISTTTAARTGELAPVEKQRYVGISYELLLLTDDGQIKKVSKNRVFKSGERLIMRVMTNRAGYLSIANIGPTGNYTPLFNDYVEAFTVQQIPKGSNFRFVGSAGTETLIMTLSDAPLPTSSPGSNVTAGTPSYNAPSSETYGTGNNSSTSTVDLIAGAKRIQGAKDIAVEDRMGSTFAVVSPQNNWQPVKSGKKDIIVESSHGTNYGVVPVSSLSDGRALSLIIKLTHK